MTRSLSSLIIVFSLLASMVHAKPVIDLKVVVVSCGMLVGLYGAYETRSASTWQKKTNNYSTNAEKIYDYQEAIQANRQAAAGFGKAALSFSIATGLMLISVGYSYSELQRINNKWKFSVSIIGIPEGVSILLNGKKQKEHNGEARLELNGLNPYRLEFIKNGQNVFLTENLTAHQISNANGEAEIKYSDLVP